jgi:hypothetical protein
MSLPIISTPKYTLTLPSNGTTVEYRPFLVKEEKILLIAQESDDQVQIIGAIKDVISSCTFGKINPDTLTSFDLEYVFIKLRAKSVGEVSSIGIKCSECEASNNIDVNLDEIEMTSAKDVNHKIALTDTVGVNMKYMSVRDLSALSAKKNTTNADILTDAIIACVDSIYDDTTIYAKENTPKAEMVSFIESLNRSQMQKIEQFMSSMPKLEHTVHFTCSKCKHENDVTLSGVQSFFV